MPRQHHPIADLFPMLAEDELRELAADIKQRGQLQPIVLDTDGRILDGRNRYAACELAGVEPWFEDYKGDDPGGYALSVNVNRREMTKGQKAMVIVQASEYTEYTRDQAEVHGVSKQYVSRARVVRDFAPDCVKDVIKGRTSLNDAYEAAQRSKADADSETAKLAELRKLNPELAVLAENGVRKLEDALKEAGLRALVADVDDILTADEAPEPTFASRAESGTITWDEAATLAKRWRGWWSALDQSRRCEGGPCGPPDAVHHEGAPGRPAYPVSTVPQ